MGSAQSYLPQETATALTVVVVMGAIGLACRTQGISAGDSNASIEVSAMPMVKNGKKKKKQDKLGDTTHKLRAVDEAEPVQTSKPQNIADPDVIPGQFDVKPMKEPSPLIEDRAPASKKSNRKKASNLEETLRTNSLHSNSFLESPVQTARNRRPSQKRQSSNTSPLENTQQSSEPLHVSTTSIDTDSSWTRVGSRRVEHSPRYMEHSLGDIKVQTDTSSFASHTEDEAHDSFLLQQHTSSSTNRDADVTDKKTLAEKLLPKPKKSKVDDMLENPDYPPLSRVMRVAPSSNDDPVIDFSLADDEDVRDAGGNDADGEDDGWGVVTSKRPRRAGNTAGQTPPPPSSQTSKASKASEPLSKRQRQNVQKREKQKAEKADAEAQRLTTLEKHKRGLEKVRMAEQFGKSGSSVSGGMKATVDERGKLVWE